MSQLASLLRPSRGDTATLITRSPLTPVSPPALRGSRAQIAPPQRFSVRLREETDRAHRLTESTGFVRGILKGSVDLRSFRTMQAGLYLVYSAMEEELARNASRSLLRMIDFPELHRREALRRDLSTLYGEDWQSGLVSTPARRRYVERIRWVGEHDPDLLVAHSYTRYLGDLSGGRVVETIARRALRIEGREGLHFFHFPDIPDRKAFKTRYRRRLDEMPLDPARADTLVSEANRVFAFNRAIFEELEGSWLRALRVLVPRPLTDIRKTLR